MPDPFAGQAEIAQKIAALPHGLEFLLQIP